MPENISPDDLPEGFTPAELKEVQGIRRSGRILYDIDDDKFAATGGRVAFCGCADGHRFCNIHAHLARGISKNSADLVIHTISMAGAVLRIPYRSPVFSWIRGDDNLILSEIAGGEKLKAITTVILVSHWPCGAARESGVGFYQSLRLFARAKRRVREKFPDLKVGCFLDFDFGKGRQRTYRLRMRELRPYLGMH